MCATVYSICACMLLMKIKRAPPLYILRTMASVAADSLSHLLVSASLIVFDIL